MVDNKIVSVRLKSKGIDVTGVDVMNEVRLIKKDDQDNISVITECCLVMKDNGYVLDSYCLDFLKII